jgi:hypothetical protein
MLYYRVTFKSVPAMSAIMAVTAQQAIEYFEQHLATYPLPDGTPNWREWGKPVATADDCGFAFTVSYPDCPLKYARRFNQSGVQATSPENALASPTLYTWCGVPVKATLDRTYDDRQTKHKRWADIWGRAMANMPHRKGEHIDGRYGALARCLGLPLYSPAGYSGHNRVYTSWQRGYEPSDPKVKRRLHMLAGSNGALLAWVHLTRLGIAHRYIKPDRL